MNQITVLHQASREYVCPTARNRLDIKLLCGSRELADCRIVYWNRFFEDDVKTEEMVRRPGCGI